MRKYIFIFLISIFIIVLQQAVFSRINISGVSFDIVFVFVICFSILLDELDCVILALICGIIRDCFFPVLFGINSIVYLIAAYVMSQIQKRIYKDALIIPMFFTFIMTIFKNIIYFSYFYIASIKFDFKGQVLDVLLLESLYNSILSIFVYRFAKNICAMKIMQREWKF